MFNNIEEQAFNRYVNLNGIEDKIIFYLFSDKYKNFQQKELVDRMRRLFVYSDKAALINDSAHPNPTQAEINALIANDDIEQSRYRIFRTQFNEDVSDQETIILKVFVERILPINHVVGQVNVGLDVIVHNKLSTLINPLYDDEGKFNNPTEGLFPVQYLNRATTALQAIIASLNGTHVGGVGLLQMNNKMNRYTGVKYGLFNNRTTYGHRVIMGCEMSGVSAN